MCIRDRAPALRDFRYNRGYQVKSVGSHVLSIVDDAEATIFAFLLFHIFAHSFFNKDAARQYSRVQIRKPPSTMAKSLIPKLEAIKQR